MREVTYKSKDPQAKMSTSLSVWVQNLFTKPAIQILLIVLSGGLAYSNTFHVPFVLDDYHVIVENPKLANITSFLSSDLFPSPRWVALATFALNRSVSGLDVVGFHAVNLGIHLATGIVVFFLAKITIISFEGSSTHKFSIAPLLASLAFVLHPLHTQSVTYIVQRMTSLATFFYLAALLLYARTFVVSECNHNSVHSSRYTTFVLSLLCCFFAMGTKEICFTLPLAFTMFDICFLKGSAGERFRRLAPFWALMIVLSLYLVGMEKGYNILVHGGGDDVSYPPPHVTYLITELSVICTYLRLMILPVNQNLDYDFPFYTSIFHYQVAIALFVLSSLLFVGILFLVKSFSSSCRYTELMRVIGFAVVWFFVTISVESGLVPLIDTIFEHRAYTPSVWFFISFGMLLSALCYQCSIWRNVILSAVTIVFLGLGFSTFFRNAVWKDTVSLWTDVINKSPAKVRGWVVLGSYYVDRLDPSKAIPLLEHAINLNPNYHHAHCWLGRALILRGEYNRALKHYQTATILAPRYSKGWESAGRLLLESGQFADAVVYLRRALELDPDGFVSYDHLKQALKMAIKM